MSLYALESWRIVGFLEPRAARNHVVSLDGCNVSQSLGSVLHSLYYRTFF